MKSPALLSMMRGQGPQNPAEWQDLGEFLSKVAGYCMAASTETDLIEDALIVMERVMTVLAEAADERTKALIAELTKEDDDIGSNGQGFHVPEVQDEDDISFD